MGRGFWRFSVESRGPVSLVQLLIKPVPGTLQGRLKGQSGPRDLVKPGVRCNLEFTVDRFSLFAGNGSLIGRIFMCHAVTRAISTL